MENIADQFEKIGGRFMTSYPQIVGKIQMLKAIVFDWDGVFNTGTKGGGSPSTYNEADSMGTNLLRFGLFRLNGSVPPTSIITGAVNETAIQFVEREHFDQLYFKSINKKTAFKDFLETHGLSASEVVFFYDDVLDLSLAEQCGLAIQIRRHGSPLFDSFTEKYNYPDYITGNYGGQNAIREGCELILGAAGLFEEVMADRLDFTDTYQKYLQTRNEINTEINEGMKA